MEIFLWIKAHFAHLLAGSGSVVTILAVTFKDSLRELWKEWHDQKRMARDAHLAASGKDSQLANAFLALLKSDLESQSKTRDEMVKAISQLAKSTDAVLDTQRTLSNQIHDMNKDILVLKGAILGRMQ